MKFTSILLLVACLQVSARGYTQKVSISEKNASLQKVFKEINRQTGFTFFYSDALMNEAGKINIEVTNVSIDDVLKICFKNQSLTYTVIDKTIIIKPKEKKSEITATIDSSFFFSAPPPPLNITGIITDEKGNPISGVSVTVKDSKQGTTTNTDGKFFLSLPDDKKILTFSFIGYKTIEMPVTDQKEMQITMIETTNEMDKVVVVGYGTQIKKNVSSSISTVDLKSVNTTSANSFEAALQGQAAGVQVTQSSALGGSSVNIRIRGTSSVIGSSEPLYIIDGIAVESGQISNSNPGALANNYNLQTSAQTNVLASLNPADIETIEILKDAAAAAIYGSRGANGVVLITTKKGKAGKTQTHVSAVYGISEATNKPQLLNTDQYLTLAQEAWVNSGNTLDNFWTKSGVLIDGLTKEQAMQTNTNWTDQTIQQGNLQDYNVSVAGGNDKTSFYMSAYLKDENTILTGNKYQRFGTRLNVDHRFNKIFSIGAKMTLGRVNDQQVPTSWAGGQGKVNEMLPIWPVHKDDGSYFYVYNNPVAAIKLRTINLKSNQLYGTWYVKAKIVNGLNFRSEIGINQLNNDDFHYIHAEISNTRRPSSSVVIGNAGSWNWNNSLNYIKRFKDHNLDVLVGTEAQKYKQEMNTTIGDGYFNSALQYPQDASTKTLSYFQTGYSFLSYLGRINYDYMGKYLLSVSMRADGSSRFGANNRWGNFPSASIGYILSDEPFFKSAKNTFNFLKLRASYGIVGNAGIGNNTYSTNYITRLYNGNTGLILSNRGDDQLGWEKTAQLDLGITFEAAKGRISGELDYYNKHTTDLLLDKPVSQLTGVSSVTTNVGELFNKGFDIMLKSINISKKDFTWETSFNLNHNENKMGKIKGGVNDVLIVNQFFSSYALKEGSPVGIQPMVVWKGVDPGSGEDTYEEINSGKNLRYSQIIAAYGNFNNFFVANQQFLGNPWPKFTGGFNNRFTWKNWDMNFLFTFSTGMDFALGDLHRFQDPFGSYKINPPVYMLDRWQKSGDKTSLSRVTTQDVNWAATTEELNRTDYVRLKDLTIGYTFNAKKSSMLHGLKCYIRCSNLLTFTKAPDYYWDPEFSGGGFNNTGSLSYDKSTPQAKFYMFGLTYDFQ